MGKRSDVTYQQNRQWSDRYIPELRRLIGPHLLMPSSLEQDTKEAADLVVLRGRDMTIACRVRRPGYVAKFFGEFTLRSHVASGVTTEFEKVVDGWGDWMFYGHATPTFPSIDPWWLIDLSAFRSHMIRNKSQRVLKYGEGANNDGTKFYWFQINSFPSTPPLLVGRSESGVIPVQGELLTANDISW